MVKKTILLFFVALFLVAGSVAAQTETRVAAIRKAVAQINQKQSRFTKKSFDVPNVSPEGARAIAYFDGKTVRKIAATFFRETGRNQIEFFYQNDNLIFAFERELGYNEIFGKVVSVTERRYYFDNGELKSLIENKKTLSGKDSEFAERGKQILSLSETVLQSAREAAK